MIRVLVLVDEDVAECLSPLVERIGEALERLDGEHDQVVEVDRIRGVELSLVELVRLGDRLVPERGDASRILLRRHELVLGLRDLVVDSTWREPLRILAKLLEARLREADLVLVVVDRERRPVAEAFCFAAQDPAAGGVEREDPDRTRRPPEHPREPFPHLPCGLVRERDGEDLVRLHAARADEMCDPIGEDPRLPGPRSRDDEERAFGRQHRVALRFVQVREVAVRGRNGHPPMLAVRPAGERRPGASTTSCRRCACAAERLRRVLRPGGRRSSPRSAAR